MAVGSVGKRKAERRDCHVKAQVLVADDAAPIDCVILNFSATGARVVLVKPADLPQRFKLHIPSRPETKPVLLRWRNNLEFGVEYSTGIADENAVFDLMARVDRIEASLGGGPAPAGAAVDDGALRALERRIAELESRETAAPTADTSALETRLAQLERALDAGRADEGGLTARLADIEARMSAFDLSAELDSVAALGERLTRLESVSPAPAPAAAPSAGDNGLSRRIDELDARLSAHAQAVAEDLSERLERLERANEMTSAASVGASLPAEALIMQRIADLEAKTMGVTMGMTAGGRPAPAAAAPDHSAIERRVEALSAKIEESTMRVERFLNARIDEVERSMIAAPPPPAPVRSFDSSALELRLYDLEKLAEAPHPVVDGIEDLQARMSNLEVSLMELRADIPDDEFRARVAALENRNADVMDALRSVLAMLTARRDERRAG